MLTENIFRTFQLVAVRRIAYEETTVSILGAEEGFTSVRNYISVGRCFDRGAPDNWMSQENCHYYVITLLGSLKV